MKQQFVKNRRSGEFGYRLDTETGDAGGDGFDSVVGVKKTCKVEFSNFSHCNVMIYGDTIILAPIPSEYGMIFLKTWGMGSFVSNDRKPPVN